MKRALFAAALLFPAVALSGPPPLELPLRCTPGKDCWISGHVDLDPGPKARDYSCGVLTYEGHKGTDIALRDLKAMEEGMDVLAAAPGKVLRTRDGVPDVSAREKPEVSKGRECGNGMVIDHGDGLEVQYCHLRRGSVAVRQGESVAAGQRLGLVGMSGQSEYPHLHITVRHRGAVVDPFKGPGEASGCGVGAAPLWHPRTLATLPYAPGVPYNFGVAEAMVKPEAVRRGEHRSRSVSAQAPLIAVWFEAFGVRAGDTLEMELVSPEGQALVRHRATLERDQIRIFRIAARKRGAEPWRAGRYAARIALAPKGAAASAAAVVRFEVEVR